MLPWLLVNIVGITRIPLDLLSASQCRMNARFEVFDAFVFKQQVESLNPLLFAGILPLNLIAFALPVIYKPVSHT